MNGVLMRFPKAVERDLGKRGGIIKRVGGAAPAVDYFSI